MSADKPLAPSKRLSWMGWYTASRDKDKDNHHHTANNLASPQEGRELNNYSPAPSTHSPAAGGLPFSRSSSFTAISNSSYPSTYSSSTSANRPSATQGRRFSTNSVMAKNQLDQEASKIILNALERTSSQASQEAPAASRSSGAFSRKSFTSMMGGLSGGLSALSLSRSTDDKDRGRSRTKEDGKPRSSSAISDKSVEESDPSSASRARSTSPFRRRKLFLRDPSPSVEALKLSQSDVESDNEGASSRKSIRPRNAFSRSPDASSDESGEDEDDEGESEESWSEDDAFDPITVQNTEQNSLVPEPQEIDIFDGPDPLGEGVNIVVPPEPYFPSTLNSTGNRNPRRRKSTRHHVSLPLITSRPEFKRDRCIITLTQGDPSQALEVNGRRPKRYVVASDLSDESRYAIEWGIGTVLRDGDELYVQPPSHAKLTS